jgi:hypothetical protein
LVNFFDTKVILSGSNIKKMELIINFTIRNICNKIKISEIPEPILTGSLKFLPHIVKLNMKYESISVNLIWSGKRSGRKVMIQICSDRKSNVSLIP